MDFYFIRHGQSQNNLLWEQSGSNDGRIWWIPFSQRRRERSRS